MTTATAELRPASADHQARQRQGEPVVQRLRRLLSVARLHLGTTHRAGLRMSLTLMSRVPQQQSSPERSLRLDRARVAIVGAGASGTLVAVNLLRLPEARHLEIVLVERSGDYGPGLAYAAPPICCVMNVRADTLGLPPDGVDGFLGWVRRFRPATTGGEFLPRAWFGDYLREILQQAEDAAHPTVRLRRVAATAVDLLPDEDGRGWELRLSSGATEQFQAVVLATGNEAPRRLSYVGQGDLPSAAYIDDPNAAGALAGIKAPARLLLVGTGLTMIDTAIRLAGAGHQGDMVAISRRGLLPRTHVLQCGAAAYHGNVVDDLQAEPHLSQRLALLRRHINLATTAGSSWQVVIDALRPRSQQLWRDFSDAQKARFLRHVKPYWDVHRHRLAPQVAQQLVTLEAKGQLWRVAARISSITWRDGVIQAELQRRDGGVDRRTFDALINCTGPNPELASADNPLLQSLLRRGLLRPHSSGLGVAAPIPLTATNVTPVPDRLHLLTIGPLRSGELGETTAIGEIRVQAVQVAAAIGRHLRWRAKFALPA